jgi:hypothetical protein
MRLPERISIAPLPGFAGLKTYAAWPVWKDSARAHVKFHPMPKKRAIRLYHEARRFERQTRTPGRQDGAIGRNGLALLHALIFDCLNYASGRLDPSYETLARLANISVRSVARGLQKLKAAGVLNWIRRCSESFREGRYTLEQDSNAYAVVPASQWRGYYTPPPAPPPDRGTWGDHPPLPSALAQAAQELRQGGEHRSILALLGSDPSDALALALARLGRTLGSAQS